MLDSTVILFLSLPVVTQSLIWFGVIVAGALVAAARRRSARVLRRAPYFACTAIATFVLCASATAWLFAEPAILGGYLWAIMLFNGLFCLVYGYVATRLAMARARDGWGRSWMAVLSFVPVASLWLLFKPSRTEPSASAASTPWILTGGRGVIAGMVFLLATGVLVVGLLQEDKRVETRLPTDPVLQVATADLMLRGLGLEGTLRRIARKSPRDQRLSDKIILRRVVADGATLRFVYEVAPQAQPLPRAFAASAMVRSCESAAMRALVGAGAEIELSFRAPDGREIDSATVTRDICGP